MRLVQRLGGFIGWPISRKLFLLSSVGLFATALAALVNLITFSTARSSTMNLEVVNRYCLVWLLLQALCSAMAFPPALRGRPGRWAAYLFVTVQSPFIVGLLYLFGTMSTPLVAIYPAIVILWILVLDEWIGLFGFCNLAAWIVAAGVLGTSHRLPYAPALLQHGLDDENNPVWFWAVFFHILVLLGFCSFLCVLFQRTRRSQEQRLRLTHAALEQANRLIRRYAPAPLAEQIAAGSYLDAKPERRKLTLVFVGIEGFAEAAGQLQPEDLALLLADYISRMVVIADGHGGTVNHIVGDRILVLFGAPHATNDRDHALRAAQMALEMRQHVEQIDDLWLRYGLSRSFRIRIGINAGYASVGDFGSQGRKFYSGVGLEINLVESIQSRCAPGQILLGHGAWSLVRDEFSFGDSSVVPLDGAAGALRVYPLAPQHAAAAEAFAEADAAAAGVPPGFGAGPEPARAAGAPRCWNFGNACFDERSLQLFRAGQPVVLEHKPLEVLRYLLHHAGDVVAKDELLAAVWPGRVLSETVIAKCISRIREVLGDEEQNIIKTVHGFGYRLAAEVTPATTPRL